MELVLVPFSGSRVHAGCYNRHTWLLAVAGFPACHLDEPMTGADPVQLSQGLLLKC